MKLEDFQNFVAVASRKNFSLAAKDVHLTQSALSKSIARMEKELGQQLLVRNTHSVGLTEAGELTLKFGRRVLRQYDEYLSRLQKIRSGETGHLRFAEIYYAMDRYLNTPIGCFKNLYPDATMEIFPMEPAEVVCAIRNGEADLGFTMFLQEPSPDKQITYHLFAEERIFAVLPQDHPLTKKTELRPEDLDNELLLFPEGEKELYRFFISYMRDRNLYPGEIRFIKRASHYGADVLATQGITFFPDCMREMPNRGLTVLPFLSDMTARYYYLYRNDNTNPTIQLYLDACKQLP